MKTYCFIVTIVCCLVPRGVWYVEINRPDRDETFRKYHKLMGQPRPQPIAAESLVAIIDAFLEWTQKNRRQMPTNGIGIVCSDLSTSISN